jgi:NAD(P)-dependent dehydrogenase (short-subunit alcohol dehydrogenase family)
MTKEATSLTTDEIDEKEKAYPLGYGKPEDVSALAIYLLSDVSRWMTGSDLVIDGGLTLF